MHASMLHFKILEHNIKSVTEYTRNILITLRKPLKRNQFRRTIRSGRPADQYNYSMIPSERRNRFRGTLCQGAPRSSVLFRSYQGERPTTLRYHAVSIFFHWLWAALHSLQCPPNPFVVAFQFLRNFGQLLIIE